MSEIFVFPSSTGKPLNIPVSLVDQVVYVPDKFMNQAKPWLEFILPFFPISTDNWLVSSVEETISGNPRGGTHLDPGAIDIAPFLTLKSPFRDDKRSPRLYNNRMFAAQLVKRHAALKSPLAIVLEDDHLHIDFALKPGVYLYPYSRYPGDHFIKNIDWIQQNQHSLMRVDQNGNAFEVARETLLNDRPTVARMKKLILGK